MTKESTLCDSGAVEDTFHLVIDCTYYNDIRRTMFDKVEHSVSPETFALLESLPVKIVYYVLMGMTYPMPYRDLWATRSIVCQGIKKMYERRVRSNM